MIGIAMFFVGLLMLMIGFPVAFTFGTVAVVFGLIYGLEEVEFNSTMTNYLIEELSNGVAMFDYMPFRIYAIQ